MRTILLSTLSIFFFAQFSFAQTEKEKAYEIYNLGFYCEAVAQCKTAFSKVNPKAKTAKKEKAELAYMVGECLRNTDRFSEALDWYDRAVKLQYDKTNPIIHLRIGDMNLALCDIEAAEKAFKKYKDSKHNDKVAQERLQNIDFNKAAIANRTKHNVKPVVKINSQNTDFAPTMGDKKMSTVVYASSRTGTTGGKNSPIICEPFMDIYVAEMDKKGNFNAPEKIQGEKINTQDDEGSVCFDSKFKQMFFTRCPTVTGQNLGCEIWVSESNSNSWGEPTKIELKGGNDTVTVGHPCLTPEDDVLIFVSDLPGGYGGYDLWYSVYNKRGKSWSTPKNMGPEINTSGNEMFPTMDSEGNLYFSSNGHVGMGGLDIFMASRVGDEIKWVKPSNLGHPINSCANDFHFVKSAERKGFFTSNRPHTDVKGAYRDNIWQWELPPNLFTLDIRVFEVGYQGSLGPAIADANIKIVASDGTTWDGMTDDEGKVYYEMKPDGSRFINEETSYRIYASKDGVGDQGYYANNDAAISTIGLDRSFNFVKEIKLLSKRPIRLPEVRYALGKADLLVNDAINSKDSLNYVMEMLAEYPTMIIQLTSHTDWRGNAASNKDLSQRRAQSCVNYLVNEKGVDPRRLRARGAGREIPRTIYFFNGDYNVDKPEDKTVEYETIVLTNDYINKYVKDKPLFERLHQYNRRTEGEVVSFEFDPATAGEGKVEIEDITKGEQEEKPKTEGEETEEKEKTEEKEEK
jgi:outer membrane protein OmpA-like peptidoglycan-associated protein/tetratricopeptide (TPR) repeat protein